MKNKTGLILLHITGCIAFLSLPVLLSPDVSQDLQFIKLPPFQEDFATYTLLLLFFYLNYFWLVPQLYFKEKYVYYLFCVLACYAFITLLPDLLVPGNHINHAPPPPPHNDAGYGTDMRPMPPRGFFSMMPRFEHLFQFLIVLILSALIRINNRLKQSEKEKINAELSYLKAQINPHFLFNTLNSIYSSAIEENADNTASAVVKLSGMMRYVISEVHHDYVSLEKEINYISDYIDLQKIRMGDTVSLQYQVTGDVNGKRIAPLVLISFIENAFKHGVNPEEKSGIVVDIKIQADTLDMLVNNAKVKNVNGNSTTTNIGLENTKSRLQHLYPSKHELEIKETQKEYTVLLKMNLQ